MAATQVSGASLKALVTPSIDTTPDVIDAVALARLYGEPLFSLPTDLYIPPDALEVFLETFQGPLDLLLYLIRKQNFNVLDIPMAEVTRQYLSYVDQIRMHNLELAAEYLLMAAMLIEIKARMLLPVKKTDTGQEVQDPRAELVRRLLEYERMKLAAQNLNAVPQLGRDFQRAQGFADLRLERALPEVSVEDLRQAWIDILKRAKLNAHHHILRRLNGVRFIEFSALFMERISEGAPIAVVVVHFLALLELAREALLEITQAEPYAPIYVRLAYTSAAV